ncbi:2-C-methyl-D-erythritol 2,4-cyclodiphosphate synthase [Beauveria brongniartii RCEF 3172]|uniref:2-C-methyl-D-erythritol 2,4-cyclodiphosphate synthase n=1 Tax=Beauveria brongniartii RCEF 3172 TaxID=1081107 RepID=A0A167EJI4_9HYPO|nr:2-C-methyl-D-erythritol 2,4-cyclodiphosphate synthase [Beauveria brongniartii RCEF 3172]
MKICVFLSSYEGSGSTLEAVDKSCCNPGACTDQHTFEYRFIHKATAKQEIDAAVAEGFEFYFNFLWGSLDDPVAGIRASQYFESLRLPSCGFRSWERLKTKNDFFDRARLGASPPVPGTDRFPLFVKPANGCASLLIDERSVCHNEEELVGALRRINEGLREARVRRAEAMGIQDKHGYADSYSPVGRDSDDIVVQEFIDGRDCTCCVVKMGQGCLALAPFIFKTRPVPSMKQTFLTFELKHDEQTVIQLLPKEDDPALFERIQQAAIEAYRASDCSGSNMGCDVDMRIRPDGAVFVIEVNPQPAAFELEDPFQDLPIIHSLPGGHRAVIDIFIMNQLLSGSDMRSISDKVAQSYDEMAPHYNKSAEQGYKFVGVKSLLSAADYSGTIFDLACGTGFFGQLLSKDRKWSASRETNRLFGFDISPAMLRICRDTGHYDGTHLDAMETTLVNFARYAAAVDHVVCFAALQFLRPEAFHFVLVLCFAIAGRSITVGVDEIPDGYNAALDEAGFGHMRQHNHVANMEAFGEPPGWRLTLREREYNWTSPRTGHEIYATYFRFERDEAAQRNVMFDKEELAN